MPAWKYWKRAGLAILKYLSILLALVFGMVLFVTFMIKYPGIAWAAVILAFVLAFWYWLAWELKQWDNPD